MSRVAKNPVAIPRGVEVRLDDGVVTTKGPKGELSFRLPELVEVAQNDGQLTFAGRADEGNAWALAGTTRSLVSNMVTGVSTGFERRLTIVGVGYRAQAKGRELQLSLGFSHPVNHALPEGITAETPTQTEIVIRGADKQKVGQVAAEIRAYRPPEPYKGKGVRYSDEHVVRKQAKKK